MKRRSAKQSARPARSFDSRSLAKGIQILELLGNLEGPAGLKDISEHVELGKASALRLIKTLLALRYLERDANDNYSLGREWPKPGRHQRLHALKETATPYLAKLNAELGETVALAFLFDDVIRVVDVIESTHHIRMANYRGGVLQPYASSLGKSITAYQNPEVTQRLLYTYGIFSLTPNTLTDFRDIQDELATVRQRGFAWDREETVPGGTCIGAPIICSGGEVFAAFSMSMPKARFTKQLEELLPKMVLDYSARMSADLSKWGIGA